MTTRDKADKVIKILELVDGNVRHALKLQAYFCRAAYKDDVKTRFDQSKAASGYNQIVDSLFFELIMTVARLYDDPSDNAAAQNTASLPALMALLSHTEVVAELQARSAQRKTPKEDLVKELQSSDHDFLDKLKADAIRSAEMETSQLFSVLEEFGKLKGSHLVQRIRTIRHELFAHIAIDRNQNNPVLYGDTEELIKETTQLLVRLNTAARNLHCSYQEHNHTWQEHADFFWRSVIGHE